MKSSYFDQCLAIAIFAHWGQIRSCGEAYIEHCKRVAACFDDEWLRCVAVLHDVLEDTEVDLLDYLQASEIPPDKIRFIYQSVQSLTHNKSDSYEQYIKGIPNHLLCIKIADMFDNLTGQPTERQKIKYRKVLPDLMKRNMLTSGI